MFHKNPKISWQLEDWRTIRQTWLLSSPAMSDRNRHKPIQPPSPRNKSPSTSRSPTKPKTEPSSSNRRSPAPTPSPDKPSVFRRLGGGSRNEVGFHSFSHFIVFILQNFVLVKKMEAETINGIRCCSGCTCEWFVRQQYYLWAVFIFMKVYTIVLVKSVWFVSEISTWLWSWPRSW